MKDEFLNIAFTFTVTGAGLFAIAGASAIAGLFGIAGAYGSAVGLAIMGALAFVISIANTSDRFVKLIIKIHDFIENFIKDRKAEKSKIANPSRYKLLKMSEILFSAKTQKEVFLSVMADWDEEIFEALKKDKDVNLLMINARNTYAFLAAMWQKSLIGNLIEFVVKIAKQ